MRSARLKDFLVNILLLAIALAFVFRPAVVAGIDAAVAALQSPHADCRCEEPRA